MITLRICYWKVLFAGMLWMSLVLSGNATTYTVNSLADTEGSSNEMTLRKAINLANAKLTTSIIECSKLTGTIVLQSDLPLITGNMDIHGSGINKLAISGASAHRIFAVSGSINVNIFDLTLKEAFAKGGKGGDGGVAGGGGGGGMGAALFVNKGTVYCKDVNFVNNKVQGGEGGGWYVYKNDNSYGGGGGFAGDGKNVTEGQDSTYAGGDGGFLGEEGRGGKCSIYSTTAGNGGFGGGGGSNTIYTGSYYKVVACNGGFGGGGGGSIGYMKVGPNNGFFGGDGNTWGCGGGGAGLGGAVFVRENAKFSMKNCDFTGNIALGGTSPTTVVYAQEHLGNKGQGKGGAIFAMDNAIVKVSGNITYSGNMADNPAVSDTPAFFLDTRLDTNDFYGLFHEMSGDSTAFPPSAASNWSIYQ